MRVTVTSQSTTELAEEFLSLATVKQGLRVRHTHEDTSIRLLRNSAISKAENHARIAILRKTVRCVVRGFYYRGDAFGVSSGCVDPDRVREGIKLPLPRVVSIDSFKGVSNRGAPEDIGEDFYELEDGKRIKWLKEPPRFDGYEITYTSGYAEMEEESIELDALRSALIEIVQDCYDNPGMARALPASVKATLAPFFTSPLTS